MYKRFGRCVPPPFGRALSAVGQEKWASEEPFFCAVLASVAAELHSLSDVLPVILAVTGWFQA